MRTVIATPIAAEGPWKVWDVALCGVLLSSMEAWRLVLRGMYKRMSKLGGVERGMSVRIFRVGVVCGVLGTLGATLSAGREVKFGMVVRGVIWSVTVGVTGVVLRG